MLFYNTIEPSTLGLLKEIQSKSFFKDCRLVGGTSLALQYGHRKSVDLYELLTHFSLKQLFEFYQEKYTDAVPFLTLKSMTWFEDAETDPMPFMLRDYTWENVKQKIRDEVLKIG